MRRRIADAAARRRAPVALLLVAGCALLALARPARMDELAEDRLTDWRFLARNALAPPEVPPGVVVVAVDDQSVTRLGSWPWPRPRVAELLAKIAGGGPRAVGVDVRVAEPAASWAELTLTPELEPLRGRLAEALVVAVTGGPGELPQPLASRAIRHVEGPGRLRPVEASAAGLPRAAVPEGAAFGHVYERPDGDGRLRRELLYVRLGGRLLPSLALETARLARGLAPGALSVAAGGGVRLGGVRLPADDGGALRVNYYGTEGTLPHYSASALLAGEVPAQVLRDAVVLVGPTGIAAYDLLGTPFTATLPAVEKDATVVANVLAGDFLRDAPRWLDLFFVLAVGTAAWVFSRARRALLTLLALVAVGAVLVAANLGFFVMGVRLALAPPLLLLLTFGGFTVAHQHLAEGRSARALRALFSSYVTERVVEQLIARPELARLGGERREVTVLFADVRGFSAIAERNPPEQVVAFLNAFLAATTEVVLRWEGTIDKFIGDAVMVFWNAPLPQPDHAWRAVRCALELQERMAELGRESARAGGPALAIGIGVNSGEALVGNVGAEGRKMEYTVIGDAVNLAARVERLTRRHGCGILVTQWTLERVQARLRAAGPDAPLVRSVGNVLVKGKEQTVRLFEVCPAPGAEDATAGPAPP